MNYGQINPTPPPPGGDYDFLGQSPPPLPPQRSTFLTIYLIGAMGLAVLTVVLMLLLFVYAGSANYNEEGLPISAADVQLGSVVLGGAILVFLSLLIALWRWRKWAYYGLIAWYTLAGLLFLFPPDWRLLTLTAIGLGLLIVAVRPNRAGFDYRRSAAPPPRRGVFPLQNWPPSAPPSSYSVPSPAAVEKPKSYSEPFYPGEHFPPKGYTFRERGGCLTAFLAIMMAFSGLIVLVFLAILAGLDIDPATIEQLERQGIDPDLLPAISVLVIILFGSYLGLLIALWNWQQWAYYGLVAWHGVMLVLGFCTFDPLFLLFNIVGLVVLLRQVGPKKNEWFD